LNFIAYSIALQKGMAKATTPDPGCPQWDKGTKAQLFNGMKLKFT
jgi:hypothetical protein